MNDAATDYRDAIRACVANGKRLLDDAEWLRDSDRNPTTLALTILAEEEFAKAFLLYLLQERVIPSTPEVWRSLRDHYCKHLLTIVMEYLHVGDGSVIPRFDAQYDPERRLPREVASAVNLLRFERIGRWESPHSEILEPEHYDRATKQLPIKIDRAKQGAIYVEISREGRVVNSPASVTAEQMKSEQEKCSHLLDLALQIEAGYVLLDRDFARLKEAFNLVFTPPVRSDFGQVGEYIPGVQIYSEEWRVVALEPPDEDRSGQ
jgi:AbiV family abortive infection protein